MIKLTKILLLIVIVLTMAQCRKAIEPICQSNNYYGEKVFFSLNVNNGSKGVRTEITQDSINLDIKWSEGDTIYVAGSIQGYLGKLSLKEGSESSNAFFQGEIAAIAEQQDIYLYYLGKVARNIDVGAVNIAIDISTQNGTLDDIENYHIASAKISNVPEGTDDLFATLRTNLAIVNVDLSGFSGSPSTNLMLYGHNVYKTLSLNLITGVLSGGTAAANYGKGIQINSMSDSTYIALLPNDSVSMTFNNITTAAELLNKNLDANTFYSNSGSGITPTPGIEGALTGLFSVSDTNQVYFSQGYLQYQASTYTWRFADNQYDVIGAANSSISSSNSGWIDLFGWGTSGQITGATANQPYSIASNSLLYNPEESTTSNLTYANRADWGYNAISNGGYTTMQWRTLTGGENGEWEYLWNGRDSASIKRGWACIINNTDTINGIVLLPDIWTQPSVTFTPNTTHYNTNTYIVNP